MGIKSNRFLLIVVLFFVFSIGLKAQENNEKQSLSEIFSELQNKFGYQFNYDQDLIETFIIIPPTQDLSFKEVIAYLEEKTGLVFIVMKEDFVLVKSTEGLVFCGYIKDDDSLQPLVSVTIQGLKNSTSTDEKGFFNLSVASEFETITIQHLGYKTIEKLYNDFSNEDCSDIYITPEVQSLSEVIISHYIVKGINKINDGSYEIDFSNFDILPGLIEKDVLNSVQAFPGIQSINETVSSINIRGGTHDQNLILWDNIKMYQSGHFFGLISMYNPQITQKVTLLKNGSDVTYTDGVSGTISMKTKNTLTTEFKGNLGVNFIDANGFADIPIGEKSSMQIAARKSISEFIETPTYSKFFDRISQDTEVENNVNNILNSDEEFDFYDISLRWIYKLSDKDEIRLNFINVSNELIFNENAIVNSMEESKQSSLAQNSIAGALFYKRVWNDSWQTSFELYETDYKLKAINSNILENQRFLQENIVSETSIKVKVNYNLNKKFHLLSGYHFVETEVTNLDDVDTPVFRLLVSEVVRTHGVYSQIGFRSLNGKTSFFGGIRFNYIDKFEKQIWEPRFSFSHKFFRNFVLEILGEMKHQNVSQIINFQNDFLGIEKRRWQLSNNDDIPVITSEQVSLGVSYSKKGWLVSAEAYYKNIDGITTQSQGFQNQYEFLKTNGSYRVTGLDFLVRKEIQNFNSWLSYSQMNNDYTFKSLPETTFPSNYDITHVITFGTAYNIKNLKISAGLNWRTGKPITTPINGNEIINGEINYGTTNTSNLDDFLRVDISAMYDFNLGNKMNANFGVSVWNVLDANNEINNYYRIINGTVNETTQSSLGITPNVFLRVYF